MILPASSTNRIKRFPIHRNGFKVTPEDNDNAKFQYPNSKWMSNAKYHKFLIFYLTFTPLDFI